MEGFLSGFKLAPKPLRGVELVGLQRSVSTQLPIKPVLVALTSAKGLTSWLGETTEFIAHVGIKFETIVEGEKSKAVFTTLDLPKRIVFMVEALGEFEFGINEKSGQVLVQINLRRAVAPDLAQAWKKSVEPIFDKLEKILKNG